MLIKRIWRIKMVLFEATIPFERSYLFQLLSLSQMMHCNDFRTVTNITESGEWAYAKALILS